jgi:hypothetical protein
MAKKKKKKKDKEAVALKKAVNAAAKDNKNVSKSEEKFIKDLQKAALKDGNVTKKELAGIKREIRAQTRDKNKGVASWKTKGVNEVGTGATAHLGYLTGNASKPRIPTPSNPGGGDIPPQRPILNSTPDVARRQSYPAQIKTPSTDVINLQDFKYEDAESIFNQFVRDFGGIELSILTNHKTIEGQNTLFNPIKNLQSLWKEYNPLYASEDLISTERYDINLFDFIPTIIDPVTGLESLTGEKIDNVSIDLSGKITILFNDVPKNLVVETEITPAPNNFDFDEGVVI